MGIEDKLSNDGEELGGKLKEGAGKLTGDESLEAEGQADQLSAKIKNVGESVKDFGEDVVDKVKDAFDK